MNTSELWPWSRLALILIIAGSCWAKEEEGGSYFSPDLRKPMFRPGVTGVSADRLARIAEMCADLATSETKLLDKRHRAELIGIALTIDPENRTAFTTNHSLKSGAKPAVVRYPNLTDRNIAEQLGALALEIRKNNSDARILAQMLLSPSTAYLKDDANLNYEREMIDRWAGKLDWGPMFGASDLIKRKQAGIFGLLVVELEPGQMAGAATRMSATYLEGRTSGSEARLQFNQGVGETMFASLNEVAACLEARHGVWLSDGIIEFAFQEKPSLKDDNSAGLACGLMAESLLGGDEIAAGFACTGVLNSDGSVQPVGGVGAKLRGAYKEGCRVVAIPHGNRFALSDLTVLGQAKALAGMQVFTVENFDQALELAIEKRPEKVQGSIDDFARLQAKFAAGNVAEVIKEPEVQQLLRQILEQTPNHASARLMLAVAEGTLTNELSLNGSLEEMVKNWVQMLKNSAVSRDAVQHKQSLAELKDARTAVGRLKGRIDPKARHLQALLYDAASAAVAYKESRSDATGEKFAAAITAVRGELKFLAEDPQTLEDLMADE